MHLSSRATDTGSVQVVHAVQELGREVHELRSSAAASDVRLARVEEKQSQILGMLSSMMEMMKMSQSPAPTAGPAAAATAAAATATAATATAPDPVSAAAAGLASSLAAASNPVSAAAASVEAQPAAALGPVLLANDDTSPQMAKLGGMDTAEIFMKFGIMLLRNGSVDGPSDVDSKQWSRARKCLTWFKSIATPEELATLRNPQTEDGELKKVVGVLHNLTIARLVEAFKSSSYDVPKGLGLNEYGAKPKLKANSIDDFISKLKKSVLPVTVNVDDLLTWRMEREKKSEKQPREDGDNGGREDTGSGGGSGGASGGGGGGGGASGSGGGANGNGGGGGGASVARHAIMRLWGVRS